ncbi:MAG: hypothetical protein JWQ98_585 [Chlorobi bacterium]|nr:hypothetical protein [Chlorobiota bacterium]
MNRMMALLAFGAVMAISGCSSSSPSSPGTGNPSGKLIPLALGNQWLYTSTTYDSTGAVTGTKTDTTRVSADTLIRGERFFFFNDDHATPTANRSDGIYYWDIASGTARIYMRIPGTVGDVYERGNQRYTLISTNTTVTVPAGVFSCYQISLTDVTNSKAEAILSVAPGTGTVKIEAKGKRGDGSVFVGLRSEMKSYKLN